MLCITNHTTWQCYAYNTFSLVPYYFEVPQLSLKLGAKAICLGNKLSRQSMFVFSLHCNYYKNTSQNNNIIVLWICNPRTLVLGYTAEIWKKGTSTSMACLSVVFSTLDSDCFLKEAWSSHNLIPDRFLFFKCLCIGREGDGVILYLFQV